MKSIKNYATAVARIPQYVITRALFVAGLTLIAMGNVINGDLDKVKRLNQTGGVQVHE